VTQSLEEQTPAGEAAFLARAQALGASMKTVLPGMGSYWGEPSSTRTVCSVRTAGPSATPAGYLVQAPVASVSFASPGPFATLPLWAGGSMARALDFAAWDGSGNRLPDVPAQLSIGQAGVLTTWGSGGVRMLPRRDRSNTIVSATACGHTTASMHVRASGYSPLAGGNFHSLALRADGTVAAWGQNQSGQSSVPPGLTDAVQVAAGYLHSLALRTDGTVVGWGYYYPAPEVLRDVVQVAAGGTHSLALRTDGTVRAWGLNQHGQASVPPGLTDVVQVAAGDLHSLALRADGTVVAWGNNGEGQIDVPPGLTDVVQVAAGGRHSLALKADGTVVAWGLNTDGQASVPAGLTDVVQVAGGTWHSLALNADGTVVAWGQNSGGKTSVPAELTDVVQVAAGGDHSVAIRADGTVVAWGYNSNGQTTVPDPLITAVP
jgi:alpha-tubulin suppressor-like RCC1 family protein